MQWCAACIYKAPLTSSYRGLSYSDPFGLCPVEEDGIPCTFGDLLTLNVSFGGQVGVHYDAGWTSGGVRVQLGPVGNIAIPIGKKDGKYEDATLTVSDNEISAEGYFTVLGHGGGIKCDAIGKCPELTKHHDAFSKSSGEEFTHKFRNGSKSKTGVDLPFGVNVEVDWTAAREILRRQLDKVKQLVGDPQ